MRGARPAAVLLAAVLLAGCGDRRLILKVDVLSFLDPSGTQQSFTVPAALGGVPLGEQPLVDDLEVNLLEGLSSATVVQSVTVTASVIWVDDTGSGADTLRVYLSDASTPPRSTPPALVMPVTLMPGVTDTVDAVLGDDPRVADLFTRKRLRLSVTNSLRGPAAPPDLSGSLRLRVLDAVAIASRKEF